MAFADPTNVMTIAEARTAEVVPEIWAPMLQEKKFDNLTILSYVTDLSEYLSAGGDTVHVPEIFTNTFSVQTQSTEGNGIVDATKLPVDVTLTVDTHKYIAWIFGDKTMVQILRSYNLNEKYAQESRKLLLKEVEDSLFALWSSLTTNTAVGDTTTTLSDYEIRSAINTMENAQFSTSDLAFFIHPTVFWLQLSGIVKYYTNDTAALNLIRNGGFGAMGTKNYKGRLYDVPVYTSTRVVGALQTYRNLLLAPEALAVAFQTKGGGMIRVQSDYLLTNLATLTVCDVIYGVGVLRADAGVVVNANTTAVTS
jgi:hypothetical protein